jgi:ATP-binding cassette subfamily C protein
LKDANGVFLKGMALCLLLTVFVDIAVLVVPIYDMQLYDRVIQSHNLDTVLALSFACLIGVAMYGLVDMLRSAALLAIADGIAARLHAPLLQNTIAQSLEGVAGGSLDAMRDIATVRGFLGSGAVCVPLDVIVGPLLLSVLFMLHPAYGFLAMFGASLLTFLNLLGDAAGRPGLLAANEQRQRLADQLTERLRDPEVTEGLGMLPAIGRRWAHQHEAALETLHHAHDRAHLFASASKMAKMLLSAGVMILGALMILGHTTTPGSLMGANLLLSKMLGPYEQLVTSWRQWALALAAWQRIRQMPEAGDLPAGFGHQIGQPGMPRRTPTDSAGLILQDVVYRPASLDRDLLKEISVTLAPGQALAVIGPNGAGKSTLLRVLAGLAEPTSGAIWLDGLPLSQLNRRNIGYLPQNVGLLDGTVGANIVRFSTGSDPIGAARQAGVHDMIGRLPRGYDTELRLDAPALSGGQLQRIGLARALFGQPRLLVLDEPDASLDSDGDGALRRAIQTARGQGSIIVMTTHRAALLSEMDLLLELREGRVVSLKKPAPAPGTPPPGTRLQPA